MSADTSLAALGAEVERLSRQLHTQQKTIQHAQDSADAAHRAVMALVEQVRTLADQLTATNGTSEQNTTAPTSWLRTSDPAAAAAQLADLTDWLQHIYAHYPGAVDALGECWPWHPTAIEELHALRGTWHAAYTSPNASPARALDWHDRHLPATLNRLRTHLGDCSLTAHRPGGRANHTRPTIPATEALPEIAAWWTTSHGTTNPPPPDPNQEAQATARRT